MIVKLTYKGWGGVANFNSQQKSLPKRGDTGSANTPTLPGGLKLMKPKGKKEANVPAMYTAKEVSTGEFGEARSSIASKAISRV